ncbi:transmembrane protein 132B isoform X1 [Musca domestica]|uniref:Transmembrane protein 132B isoform X1 n=1 Tax=Musca domestica TaxID=7370 RepID=A0ABM3UZL6_MUSDO|nr:transmembrane protein 132B isoform X1 [Musca domestica]
MLELCFRLVVNSLIFTVTLQLLQSCGCQGVEVHFESADSGFFLKHARQPPVSPEISTSHSSPLPPLRTRTTYDSILSVDRFTVVQTTQPVSIRASYGPFSTKQTVPARYIVPDTMEDQHNYLNNTTAALLELQQTNLHLDISAHLVSSYVSQDSPVLRVLFHAGADPGGHLQRQKICVLLHVSNGNHAPIKGRCMPDGEDGVCVAEVVIPFNWFHSLSPLVNKENANNTPIKVPQRFVQVSYSVFEPPIRNSELCEPKVQIQPLTSFVQVPLVAPMEPFKEFQIDDCLVILLPQQPLFPMSKFHVPVYLQSSGKNISSFTIKARVKSGIKILGATSSSDMWNISIERDNSKHSTVRVTAIRKKLDTILENNVTSQYFENRIDEIFTWLLEVADDTKDLVDGGKIVWSVTYIYDNPRESSLEIAPDDNKKRIIAKLEVNKDDIQAVLPMAKNWELMNTAVLTGRQVAQAMKVFIVSQGGKVADVTLQSSCYAEDESVIKVSSSCSSVYVDGSEIRGSSNASIMVKYGTYIGVAKFVVWMPEFPLEVYISDFRLSQIKGWKVIDEHQYIHKKSRRKKRSFFHGQHNGAYYNNGLLEKMSCRARYQQSPVEVFARFVAVDQNSGRISYFISRRTGLRVTDLVQPLLRVADPKIASLKGRILQGKSMGRTDVQVLSPITGRVIGTKEIRVGSDKVSLIKLSVRVVSGLQLTITPDNSIENGYIAETAVTHKLTAQYQEGLLDIDLEFSDGSRTPLRDISVEDYFLLVESLDTEVVAFAPMLASHHPRVIAVGEGNGNLLRITLLLSEECRVRRNVMSTKQTRYNTSPLASALAAVDVDFNNANEIINKHEVVQNDGVIRKERNKYTNNGGDLADIIGIPLRDSSHHHEPTVQARQHHGNSLSTDKTHFGYKKIPKRNMSSIEVGMYVLLTAFCFAIVVFVISCVVYASKFKAIHVESTIDSEDISKGSLSVPDINKESKFFTETTTNAHDWVWLGRSTMDRSSILSFNSQGQNFINPRDSRIRITTNPIVNCASNNTTESKATSFMNPNPTTNVEIIGQNNKLVANVEIKPSEYRPPVPPHRNISIKHVLNQNSSTAGNQPDCAKGSVAPMCDRSNILYQPAESSLFHENHLKTSPGHHSLICMPKKHIQSFQNCPKAFQEEKHNAEKLVECLNQKINVFQFDTLTPNKNSVDLIKSNMKNEISLEHQSQQSNTKALVSESKPVDDNRSFVKPEYGQSHHKTSRVKRATVVGNPMFSSTVEDENEEEECLSLDDLDMDYEQIMNYFDNLKESNA